MKMVLKLFLQAVLLGLLGVNLEVNAQESWTFASCSSDVEYYFQSYFPEYVVTGRRLRQLQSEPEEFESLFLSRSKLANAAYSQPGSDSTTAASSSGESNPLFGVGGKLPKAPKTSSVYLPPPGSWDKARMAAAGCTTCTDGCCDAADITLDCGTMQVPENYSNPSFNITLTVYRVRITAPSLSPASRTHLWILQGGPGASGLSILPLAIPSLQFATDIYVPDHRGVAFSAELKCPIQQFSQSTAGSDIADSEVAACVTSGETYTGLDFQQMTTTNAANDLGVMITDAKSQFSPSAVYVHGYSYGTRWAQRFLQLYPALADKVVIEGIVAKDTVFNDFAVGSQYAGTRFMQKCLANNICSDYFSGTSLSAEINAIHADGNSNECTLLLVGSGATVDDIRSWVQNLLYQGLVNGIDGPYTGNVFLDWRTFYLALISRWVRCKNSQANYKAFAAGISYILSLSGGLAKVQPSIELDSQDQFNDIVYGMVVYSEMWRYPTEDESTYNTENANVDWCVVSPYLDFLSSANAWSAVAYTPDSFNGNSPSNVESELLLINGEIDGQTPRFQTYATFDDITITGSGSKTLAVINDAGHHASGFGCGQSVAKSFYSGATNVSCAITSESSTPLPLESGFTVPSVFTQILMGTTDAWDEQSASASFCTSPPTSSSGYDYCTRCFDYCLLLTNIGSTSDCSCAFALSTCLTKAGQASPVDQCSVLTLYYYLSGIVPSYGPQGSCYRACSGIGLGTLAIALIASGAFLVFITLATILIVRSRRSTNGGVVMNTGGGIMMGSTANGPVITAVAVAPTSGAVVVAQPIAATNPISSSGGVILSPPRQ